MGGAARGGVDPRCWEPGGLVVEGLSVRYASAARPALRALRLAVLPGTTVGIVGRTGAGKSTLALALFRLLEPEAGAVWLSGVDTSTLGLRALRQRLAAIPQEPTLFEGRAGRECRGLVSMKERERERESVHVVVAAGCSLESCRS